MTRFLHLLKTKFSTNNIRKLLPTHYDQNHFEHLFTSSHRKVAFVQINTMSWWAELPGVIEPYKINNASIEHSSPILEKTPAANISLNNFGNILLTAVVVIFTNISRSFSHWFFQDTVRSGSRKAKIFITNH